MRTIALEEAFWAHTLKTPSIVDKPSGSGSGVKYITSDLFSKLEERLGDFTKYRLPEMDANGIDLQVLSLTTPGIQRQADVAVAVDDAKRANDFVAEIISKHPDRFAGFATIALQDPKAAVKELARSVEQLGFKGVLINGPTLGHFLDERQFDPIWAELERLDVPVYLHPCDQLPGDKWSVLEGYPELWGPMYYYQADTAAHALRMVLGGVFDRHPRAKLILGHMGELLPLQLARLDNRFKFSNSEGIKLNHPPSYYIRENMYITTSGAFDTAALIGAIFAIGVDNIMFSVDYPYEDTAVAREFLDKLPLSPMDQAKISHLNAERILKIPPASDHR